MNVLINYADKKYAPAQRLNSLSGRYIAHFDKILSFRPEDIDKSFIDSHKDIFAEERGNGLWLWKPYIINKVIHSLDEGDIVFYCDSGSFFIRNPKEILSLIDDKSPIFVCDIPLIESCWTKPECFKAMDCDTDEIRYSNQIIGTYFAVYINDFSKRIITEWLNYCSQYDLLSPKGLAKGMIPNHNYGTDFVSHREDQSIFSLICKKHGVIPHKDICQRKPEEYKSKNYAYKEPSHNRDIYKPVLYLHKSPSIRIMIAKKIYSTLRLYKIKQILKK